MSGGVDSSVACQLLLEAGYEVRGATIRTWDAGGCETQNSRSCCARDGIEDSRRVASKLGIPYYIFNFEREFREHVIDYFKGEYLQGRTPNPCIACNEHVKFRLFLKRGQALGIDYMATGHYAQVEKDEASGRFLIREGVDTAKDQSYVLYGLDQDVLSRCVLPVGKYKKEEIRRIAGKLGLCNAAKPDSMEICFVPKNDYREFLQKAGMTEKPGAIRDTAGNILGEHKGYFRYTIGQRRGIGLAAKEPLYVKSIHPETNEVVVGTKAEVFQNRFRVVDINWSIDFGTPSKSAGFRAGENEPRTFGRGTEVRTFHFDVKIRSNHKKAPAVVECVDERTAEVSFAEPQDAVTPGQSAVFYDGPVVAGGGKIRL